MLRGWGTTDAEAKSPLREPRIMALSLNFVVDLTPAVYASSCLLPEMSPFCIFAFLIDLTSFYSQSWKNKVTFNVNTITVNQNIRMV